MGTAEIADTSSAVARHLPYLRRYARALTGSQSGGDNFAVATLEAILAEPSLIPTPAEAKVALFAVFHRVWASAGAPVGDADTALSARAQGHMARLTPFSREALLLSTVEEFSPAEVGRIIGTDATEAAALRDLALREMETSVRGRVMVIEDEAIISMELAAIIEGMGHAVTGIARTHREAVKLASADLPDLILADIQLADNSSGVEAVNEILARFDTVPVVFITAFPERLLTGLRPEPAFLINKPYSEEQVRSAVSQALFFASTETLGA
ncbi:response regulator [Rhodobacter sp. Har01]|uniref:response regulator n=1 Tax=Rhodobacter sp. Har01 TaxID=2883999 RepID=UPI001D07E7A7|nr:response regulator [Rhodobacter sp. Har01]MCB6176586.1 response regulator [Rhodobacter sp. Har01]